MGSIVIPENFEPPELQMVPPKILIPGEIVSSEHFQSSKSRIQETLTTGIVKTITTNLKIISSGNCEPSKFEILRTVNSVMFKAYK